MTNDLTLCDPNSAQDIIHLKTYTAGEDGGRLAELAKEFGLQHQRRPRKQVRQKSPIRRRPVYTRAMARIVQDHNIEVANMRAAYARERHEEDVFWHMDDVGVVSEIGKPIKFVSDMPDWMEAIELEETDLHAHGIGGDLTSAVLGIIKGMVGPAILYLPHGLAKSGYALAIPIMLSVTFLFLFSCQCLLDSWRMEHTRLLQQAKEKYSYDNLQNSSPGLNPLEEGSSNEEETATESTSLLGKRTSSKLSLASSRLSLASSRLSVEEDLHHHQRTFFLSYPELAYRAFGIRFEQLVKLGITLMQSCVCLTYLIFVPQNLSKALQLVCGTFLAPEWFLILMIAVQVPLSWIRDIRKLTATNLLANILILYGLIVCICLALQKALSSSVEEEQFLTPLQIIAERFQNLKPFGSDWFMFIGTSVFMFEGSITVLVPLQEAVFTEEDRDKFPVVNRNTTLCIIAFYIFFSVTCWMALGNDVRTVLTTSLPSGAAATSVQIAYSIAVIFTFPLQNYPALEIAGRSITKAIDSFASCKAWNGGNTDDLRHNLISSVLVILLAVVAVTTMNSLDKVVSFLGGLLGCPIAFIFPPLIHVELARREGTLTTRRKIMDLSAAFMGVVAMVLSTVTTLFPSS